MKQGFSNRRIVLTAIFLAIGLMLLITGCAKQFIAVDDKQHIAVTYDDNPSWPIWNSIKDRDDVKKLKGEWLNTLKLDMLNDPYTIENMVIHHRYGVKRKHVGFAVIRIEAPPELIKTLLDAKSFEIHNLKNYPWYENTLRYSNARRNQLINGVNFLVIDRSVLDLREILALCARPDALYLLTFYAPRQDYETKFGAIFKSILSDVSFDEESVQKAYEKSRAGFLTGLWHGFFWGIRWIYSWAQYYDVWPDRNTGFGYVCGFLIGMIVSAIGTISRTARGKG